MRTHALLIAALISLSWSTTAEARRVPLHDSTCDLASAGLSTNTTGVAYNPAVGFVIVDSSADDLFFVDADCTVTSPSFGIGAFTTPSGVAWNQDVGEYAVSDSGADELVFLTPTGIVSGSCDLAALTITASTGVAWDPVRGQYAVVDSTLDEVFWLDDTERSGGTCALVSQFDIGLFSTTALDLSYDPTTGMLLLTDSAVTEVLFVDAAGTVTDQFDTTFTGSTKQGVTYDPTIDRYFLLDAATTDLVQVDGRGTDTLACDTSTWLSTTPTGLDVLANGQLLLTDSVADQIYVVDPATCGLVRQLGTSGAGATDPQDVAYIDLTNEFVVADRTASDLFFFNATTGALVSRCDTESLGYLNPTGVDYIEDLDLLAVTTDNDDGWLLADATCTPVHSRSAGMLDRSNGSNTPQDITWHPGTGTFLIIDSQATEVFQSNFEGLVDRRFDLGGLGLSVAKGIAASPSSPTTFWVVDDATDDVHRLVVPALAEAASLSGRFSSASATVYLWERGEGRVTGTAILGPNLLPVFGEWAGSGGSLAIGAVTPTGSVVAFPITVSADLSTINAPQPVGTLTRDF